MKNNIKLYLGDCIDVMKKLDDNSVNSIVSDPPYELGFMGKSWDNTGIANNVEMWKECLRVLKPGGHLLAFSATRTYHRMTCAIEDAGFEVRDMIEWVYGCLSEDTEILTINGWERYHKDIDKSPVLCYNIDRDSFEFNKPIRKFNYENKHTAYRIKSDKTDQIVSRNHRVLIERGGRKVFAQAETLERKENIPFLESLQDLPETIYNAYEGTSITKHDLLSRVQECDIKRPSKTTDNAFNSGNLSSLWKRISDKKKQTFKILLKKMQWKDKRENINQAQVRQDGNEVSRNWFIRKEKSCVERWSNLFQEKGKLWQIQNKICEMSTRIFGNGKERRLCYGASFDNGSVNREMLGTSGSGASYKSQSRGQSLKKSNVISEQFGTQITRSTITPIEYKGKVWCVEVPTGAFVARRNGQVFITGNSGFPKSLNIGKAVDKLQGNEREVTGLNRAGKNALGQDSGWNAHENKTEFDITKGTSEYEGWGTALKPAHEPICMARKPLSEKTVAENCLKWGTGGINIDESRVESNEFSKDIGTKRPQSDDYVFKSFNENTRPSGSGASSELGRFPANLILEDCEEVRECFPETGKAGNIRETDGITAGNSIFGIGDLGKRNPKISGDNGGNASRFFKSIIYQAKASKSERNKGCEGLEEKERIDYGGFHSEKGLIENNRNPENRKPTTNNHPTVKPIALMEYLIKMVTPKSGIVLDPFMGSGSTGCAAKGNGFGFIGIELSEEYIKIAQARIKSINKE